jgi:preprotein translocase subunit SecD
VSEQRGRVLRIGIQEFEMTILVLIAFVLQSFWWEVASLGQDARETARSVSRAESGFRCSDPITSPDIQFILKPTETVDSVDVDRALQVIDARAASLGYAACNIALDAQSQIVVKLLTVDDPAIDIMFQLTNSEIANTLSTVGLVELIDPGGRYLAPGEVVKTSGRLEAVSELFEGDHTYEVLANNANIVDAYPTIAAVAGKVVLGIEFDHATGERLLKFTTENVNGYLSIVIDDEVFVSPEISAPFSDICELEQLSNVELRKLLAILRSGPLPILLTVVDVSVYSK